MYNKSFASFYGREIWPFNCSKDHKLYVVEKQKEVRAKWAQWGRKQLDSEELRAVVLLPWSLKV